MILEINEKQAQAILEAASFCANQCRDFDLNFLFPPIKEAFPYLWAGYTFLEKP